MLKHAATKLAHSTTLPVLGNKELKPLQDLIIAEKTVLVSLQKLSSDLSKASDILKVWASNEGEELEDILGASSKLLNQFSVALYQYSSYQHAMREHMKAVRDREEALEELKRRRRSLLTRSQTVNRKVSKLGSASRPKAKNLADQVELANRTREQIDALNEEITNEEAALMDYKKRKARAWMEIKFGGLLECCEKGSIACDFGKLIINEISDKHSQPGLPRLPYTKQSKVKSILQAALQRGEAIAFTSFSLESNPKEFVSRSRANSVSSMYEEENDEQTNSPAQTLHPHNRNDSVPYLSNPSSNSVSSFDDRPTRGQPLEDSLQQYSSDLTSGRFPQPQDNTPITTAFKTGSNDLPGTSSNFEAVPVTTANMELIGLQVEPDPVITPTATSSSTALSSEGSTLPLPLSEEANEEASATTERPKPASVPGGGRGGRFAAFPVKKRVPTSTDRSVAQSAYVATSGFETRIANPVNARPTTAIYTGPDTSISDSVEGDRNVEKEEKEFAATPRSSALIEAGIPLLSSDLESSTPVSLGYEPPPLELKAQTLEGLELNIPPTPRHHLPSPRFSSHFTTKAYFEVLSQRKAQDSLPPLPPLPVSAPSNVGVDFSTSFASAEEEELDERNTVWVKSETSSDPSTPRAVLTPAFVSNAKSESPSKASVEADENSTSNKLTPNTFQPSSSSTLQPHEPSESPSISSSSPLEPSTALDLEPTLDSSPQPTLSPEIILAPAPIHPNRVRFASNPVEIPLMRPRDSWDSLFTEDDEDLSSSKNVDLGQQLALDGIANASSSVRILLSSDLSSYNSVQFDAARASQSSSMVEHLSEKNSGSLTSGVSPVSSDIFDLLNAATTHASSVIATLESDFPSTSSSPSPLALPESTQPLKKESLALPSSSSTSRSPPPKRLTEENPASVSTSMSSATHEITSSSLEDISTIREPPPHTTTNVLGRNRSMMKKSLPSSPYPQRRLERSTSLSRSVSTNVGSPTTFPNVKGPGSPSLSRSSSANATVPSGPLL
ncbi:hypothetical protein F5051DRAFT_454575 [Lentinula edodes]|nr:hypothetical protein F5051DRAFT_454575 [Lentinula edodes]